MRTLAGAATALASVSFCYVLTACGASDSDATALHDGGTFDGGTVTDTGTPPPPVDTGPPPPPPEKEVESSYRSPVATGKYVWIANPKSGRVAYIDATSLDVKVVEAGNGPTYMAAVPSPTGDDVAVVLNVLSDDATLLRKTSLGLTAKTFTTHHGANAWQVSSDGHWAIAWSDAKGVATADKTIGFQDLTVIDLTETLPPTILAVGYRPVSVGFTKDGGKAYAVTQDGVSIIDLGSTGPLVTKNVAISDDPLEDPGTRDVSVTPDGSFALIRRDGKDTITVVGLVSESRVEVKLSGPVTDLDLSDDGTRAIAVIRDKSEVAVLPIPAIADKPTVFSTITITGETVGSVSIASSGSSAVLYTNAIPTERFTVLEMDPLKYHVMKLYSPVLAVFPTPDARNAVVVHDKPKDPGARAGAFSLVPIASGLPAKIVGTDAPILSVAIAPSGDRAFLTERDDVKKIFGVYAAKMPSLAVDRYALASPPIAVGVVAGAGRAFVAQEHPEGRITFVDLGSGTARTLTGFELSARIVDGSTP